MRATFKVTIFGVLVFVGISLCLACGSPAEQPTRTPTEEDLAVKECKRMLLDRYGSRLKSRRFPAREKVSVIDDGGSWEVMFTTRPRGSEYPILATGSEGLRRENGEWTADQVSVYE